jgi:hypothetical protein
MKKHPLIAAGDKINDQSIVVVKGSGKLNHLTELQEKHMATVRKFWLDYILSCNNTLDRDKAKGSIEWLYQFCGFYKPIIIFLDSPMACQYAIPYISAISNIFRSLAPDGNSPSIQQVESQVRSQVESQVRSQVRSQVESQVGSQVWSQVRSQVGSQVRSQVRSQVESQVRSQVRSQVESQGLKYEPFSTYGNVTDYGWVSFYDFFTQVGIVENKSFDNFKSLLLSGIYDMIQLNGFCIVSGLPTKIIRNNQGRLHNPTGPAIEFKDGYKQYYINGRALPEWIWEKAAAGEITKKMFLDEKNSDIKGGVYEVLGQKKMMDILGAVEIDTRKITHANGDIETVTLLKTKETFEEINDQPFAWVKMICPSTGTQYLQGVEPHHTNALEAIASLSPFKASEYSFNYRS